MKKIEFKPTVFFVSAMGKPMELVDDAGNKKQFFQSQYEFFINRTNEASFIGNKLGMEAIAFVMAAREELWLQNSDKPEHAALNAAKRGYWLLEDSRADAMLNACKHANFDIQAMVNLEPFFTAIDKAVSYDPVEEAKKLAEQSAQAEKSIEELADAAAPTN